ncbi:hypothetical protein GWK47_045966 [Chionoecetes opilio]|uniref:Uncharacterized protein n=1 Tax=Chionoecetes opilio TaxID=41210 RepID=A0A8J5CWK9_CHIOP|nr:hypothetical protein GWK47_045966 [Chionoecetes opilio]
MAATRKSSQMWLLDKAPEPDILGSRLPSREQVFLFFMYQHHVFKKTVPDSVSATSEKLKAIWGKAKLTTKTDANIRKKSPKSVRGYQALKKIGTGKTDGAELKRKIWKGDLEDLFDISSADVLERRDILDEDKSFLISQREDRSSSSMAGVRCCRSGEKGKKKRKPLRSFGKNRKRRLSRRLKRNAYWRRSPIRDLAFPHRLLHRRKMRTATSRHRQQNYPGEHQQTSCP